MIVTMVTIKTTICTQIVILGIRHKGTVELAILQTRFDGFVLLNLIERLMRENPEKSPFLEGEESKDR